MDDELRRQQDEAIARASERSQPIRYPGGAAGRAEAERQLAETLRQRHDSRTVYGDEIVGRQMLAEALDKVAEAEDNPQSC